MMIEKIRNRFLDGIQNSQSDIFEIAKNKLIADFSIFHLLFSFAALVFALFTNDIHTMTLVGFFFLIYIASFLLIKYKKAYNSSAQITSISIILGLIFISLFNHATLDMLFLSNAMIAILFSYLVLGRGWTIFITIIFSIYLIVISNIVDTEYFNSLKPYFNPDFDLDILRTVSPFYTLLNMLIFIKLLDFHSKNQKEVMKLAMNSNKLKEGILGVVAHDLRGPIANIVVVNEFLKANLGEPSKDDGESIAYTGMIDDMCNRSLAIIHDLVDIAEIESADYTLEFEKLDLVELIDRVLEPLKIKANKKNIEIDFQKIEKNILLNLNADKFPRVIENLVTNAIKFTKENGSVKLTITPTASHVLLKLEDNGIGIPARLQKMVFEKFTSAGRRGTAGEKSLGIGMSITKRLVELHNGKIWFTSNEGVGTIFYVQLPLV